MAYKHIELAMEACHRANRRLIIIGDGPEGRNLRSLDVKGVDFLGQQPRKEQSVPFASLLKDVRLLQLGADTFTRDNSPLDSSRINNLTIYSKQ